MMTQEFMTSALTHPSTATICRAKFWPWRRFCHVEVSQVFGELLGVWCVASWERLGRPSKLRLIEMGPGRGTLMADVLRSTAIFDGFHSALSVHMVEVSSHLQGVQKETLRGAAAEEVAIDWHDSLERVPSDKDVPELTLAHEFLDALPVHQLVRTPRGWRERMVDLSEHVPETNVVEAIEPSVRDLNKDERSLDFVLSANPTPASLLFGERLSERTGSERSGAAAAIADDADDNASVLGCLEVCPGALSFTQQLCRRIVKSARRGTIHRLRHRRSAKRHSTRHPQPSGRPPSSPTRRGRSLRRCRFWSDTRRGEGRGQGLIALPAIGESARFPRGDGFGGAGEYPAQADDRPRDAAQPDPERRPARREPRDGDGLQGVCHRAWRCGYGGRRRVWQGPAARGDEPCGGGRGRR